jgi:hypothetical protein
MKDKINALDINSKNKNIRELHKGINKLKNGHQPRSNLVKKMRMVICLQITTATIMN